jgi:hypothetical protein
MTKKNYIDAAGLLKMSLDHGVLSHDESTKIAHFLCVWFGSDNARFNPGKFLAACGMAAIKK